MRALFAVAAVLVVMGGCGDLEAERKKDLDQERFSAGRIGGKFEHDDPIVQMLAPEQQEALRRSGMLSDLPPPEDVVLDENGEPLQEEPAEETAGDKVGGAMMSVLAVVVPLGMMVAPYLLF